MIKNDQHPELLILCGKVALLLTRTKKKKLFNLIVIYYIIYYLTMLFNLILLIIVFIFTRLLHITRDQTHFLKVLFM